MNQMYKFSGGKLDTPFKNEKLNRGLNLDNKVGESPKDKADLMKTVAYCMDDEEFDYLLKENGSRGIITIKRRIF